MSKKQTCFICSSDQADFHLINVKADKSFIELSQGSVCIVHLNVILYVAYICRNITYLMQKSTSAEFLVQNI